MDTPKVLTRDEALALVRRYKQVIASRFSKEPMVYLFGSYSKGTVNPWSDKVSLLIEPVLMSEEENTMLYRDVLRTGIVA